MVIPLHLCVLYGSESEQKLLPYVLLTDCFLQPKWRVFTARYALRPYKRRQFSFLQALEQVR